MLHNFKNQTDILKKLSIEELNPMQQAARETILSVAETILLSPTGTGKTLAFLLPLVEELDASMREVQALILVPSRELALQIEGVVRQMGTGFKANAVYGGRSGYQDKIDLKHLPAILIGTPGRIADHLRRNSFSTEKIRMLVLDEFDKSLEVGFEAEMSEIMSHLHHLNKKILTSASNKVEIPKFVGLKNPVRLNFSDKGSAQLSLKIVVSPAKDKLHSLLATLKHLGDQPGIVFCNFKDTISYVSDFLTENHISHGCFYGDMEQRDRELALIKFRNGTHRLLLATDLAARGIDVPELRFIIHYQLPQKSHEFMHRNGRTARMNADGTAYILKWKDETLPEYIPEVPVENPKKAEQLSASNWKTIQILGGRRDKISKGDIAGLFMKVGKLQKEELGLIEIQQEISYVAVPAAKAHLLTQNLNNSKLKGKKLRLGVV